jgi:hypothetical protein
VQLMCTVLSLMDLVEASIDVTCLPGQFVIASNLYSGFVINHEDGCKALRIRNCLVPMI